MSVTQEKTTHLTQVHIRNNAKMVPFAGYNMPVWFTSLKEEHRAVRTDAGIFDISHMGVLLLKGENAKDFLQKVSCNDINKSTNGKMVYSMMLTHEGGVLDDIMVSELELNTYFLVINASNKPKLLAWFNEVGHEGVEVVDCEATHAFLAIQGPNALAKFKDATGVDVSETKRFSVFRQEVSGASCIVSRTGYTGEDGLEIVVPKNQAESLWTACSNAGILPSGLGARDTLRLEAGLPLYGQELSEQITPLMTRYKWVLGWGTGFIGEDVLASQKENPQKWTTVGFRVDSRKIARQGYKVIEGGEVSSGTLSPDLDAPIGMALVSPEHSEIGSKIHIEIRNEQVSATVVKIPFV